MFPDLESFSNQNKCLSNVAEFYSFIELFYLVFYLFN